MTWINGRELATATSGDTSLAFAYDGNGLRTSKTVNGVKHEYFYSGGKLLRETYGSNILDFAYNPDGSLYSFRYNQNYYYYVTNLQGDVIGLVDAEGATVASYEYDPYGKVISATGDMAAINPMRYRGYYYDAESTLYYLQSRYYDPEPGRFINADSLVSTGQGILGNNMFAYCADNPVMHSDPKGYAYKGINSQINYSEYEHTYGGHRENFFAKTSQDYIPPVGTLTVGLGYVGTAGKGGAVTVGLVFDLHGNIGLIQTIYVGGGVPTAGYFGFATISNAPTIYAQQGWAGQTGGSGTILGYEYSVFSDPTLNTFYQGHTFSAGFTPNALPIEIHGGASYSWLIWSAN